MCARRQVEKREIEWPVPGVYFGPAPASQTREVLRLGRGANQPETRRPEDDMTGGRRDLQTIPRVGSDDEVSWQGEEWELVQCISN